MQLILSFFKKYPSQSAITVIAVIFAGLAEGFGFSMLLPLLGLALNGPESAGTEVPSQLEQIVIHFFDVVGLTPTITSLLLVFVASIIIKALLVLLAGRRVGYMVAQVATDLRSALINALFKTRWEYYVFQPNGHFSNAFATEANRSATAYSFVIRMIASIVFALVYASIALAIAWEATLITIVMGLFILYILRRLVTKAKTAGKSQTSILKTVLTLLTDTLQSIKPLRAMARESMAIDVLQKETKQLNIALRSQVISKEALKALQEALITIYFTLVLYVALVWLEIPLASLLLMVFMLVKILKALQKIQVEYQSMANAESAYWSLISIIEKTEKQKEVLIGSKTPSLKNEIRLQNVRFSYKKHLVLQGSSLYFPKGSFTTLIGPSGAGKTTIIDLVTGLLLPQSGQVLVDGQSTDTIDLHVWRRMIGYVPQETLLLHDTILMNITFGDSELTEKDVESALRDAGAWDFVQKMPEGIHTIVGERGGRLSGGQRQRITIARALLRKPQLLILDESTSALDTDSEVEICETLKGLKEKITIVAISHQTALLEASDRAYRLKEGTAKLIKGE